MINTEIPNSSLVKEDKSLQMEFVNKFHDYAKAQLLAHNRVDKLFMGLEYGQTLYIGTKNIRILDRCWFQRKISNPKISQDTATDKVNQIVDKILIQYFANLNYAKQFAHIREEGHYSRKHFNDFIINNYFTLCHQLDLKHDISFYYQFDDPYMLNLFTKYCLGNLSLIEEQYQKDPQNIDYICGPYAYYTLSKLDTDKTDSASESLDKKQINILLVELNKIMLHSKSRYMSHNFIRASLLYTSIVREILPCHWINTFLKEFSLLEEDINNASLKADLIKPLITFSITDSEDLAKMTDFILRYDKNTTLSFEELIASGLSFSADNNNLNKIAKIKEQLASLVSLTDHAATIDIALHRLNMIF